MLYRLYKSGKILLSIFCLFTLEAFLAFHVALHVVPYQTDFPLIFGIYVVFADYLFQVYLALFIFFLAVFGNLKVKQLTKNEFIPCSADSSFWFSPSSLVIIERYPEMVNSTS